MAECPGLPPPDGVRPPLLTHCPQQCRTVRSLWTWPGPTASCRHVCRKSLAPLACMPGPGCAAISLRGHSAGTGWAQRDVCSRSEAVLAEHAALCPLAPSLLSQRCLTPLWVTCKEG